MSQTMNSTPQNAAPLGEYARKCVEVLSGFVPGQEDEVRDAIAKVSEIYSAEGKEEAENKFKDHYRTFKAIADLEAAMEKTEQIVKEKTAHE